MFLGIVWGCNKPAPEGEGDSAGSEDTGAAGPVVVIGAGVAGLAVATRLPGALVLEQAVEAGGRGRISGGYMLFVGTEEQAAEEVADTVEQALADWPALTGGDPTDATRDFLEGGAAVRDRLAALGLAFSLGPPDPVLGRRREHAVDGAGAALVDALLANLAEGVEIRTATSVTGLVLEEGRVVGVTTENDFVAAQAVVVASGGFASRADLLAPYVTWPDGTWNAANDDGGRGDALAWAQAAGLGTAALGALGCNADAIGIPAADGHLLAAQGAPWLLVAADGARFINETAGWSLAINAQIEQHAGVWGLSTRETLLAAVNAEDRDALSRGLRCAVDWDALAGQLGIDAGELGETVAWVEDGAVDDRYGRASGSFPDLGGEPCAFQPGRLVSKNFGGLAVDDRGAVLDTAGQPVAGLFAVGEAAGMGVPGLGGAWGFDGSLAAVAWSGFRVGDLLASE